MKTIHLLLLSLLAAALPARAEIEVRLSVKFILNSDGSAPTNADNINLSTSAAFDAEITHGNNVLAATGRGYRLRVVEYLNIQPSAPAGQAADYWFNLPARSNREAIESASIAAPVTWRRSTSALNIYVNNSSSGSCSFVGNGDSIALGSTIFATGTVLHEIGHFFNLSHTHNGDTSCCTTPHPVNCATPWVVPTTNSGLQALLTNGDGLAETINDHPCYTTDELSRANFGKVYALLTDAEKVSVNTAAQNVMSYHSENVLLDIQMDHWGWNANIARKFSCSGYTVFVAPFGSNPGGAPLDGGLHANAPLATVDAALFYTLRRASPDDVVLFRTGTYTAPATEITTPCTLRAERGTVTLTR